MITKHLCCVLCSQKFLTISNFVWATIAAFPVVIVSLLGVVRAARASLALCSTWWCVLWERERGTPRFISPFFSTSANDAFLGVLPGVFFGVLPFVILLLLGPEKLHIVNLKEWKLHATKFFERTTMSKSKANLCHLFKQHSGNEFQCH